MNQRSDEVERIKATYARYDASPAEQRKRDASNRGLAAIVRERDGAFARALRDHFGERAGQARVLDVGCGSGALLRSLVGLGFAERRMVGVDLLPDRVERARALLPGARFEELNAERLPFEAGSFDLVCAWTVLSSVLDPTMRRAVAAEMARVLAPQGAIGWYDFRYRNPSNPHTLPMTRSALRELFPGFQLRLRTVTLLPPLARRLGPLTPALYPVLAALPPLRSHLIGLLVR